MSNGLVGSAYDLARNDFMNAANFWLIAYHYNLFGDPALRQFGRFVNIAEAKTEQLNMSIVVYPNPLRDQMTIIMAKPVNHEIRLDIYDKTGRFVTEIYDGYMARIKTFNIDLPAGIYFLKISDGQKAEFKNIVVVK